MKKLLIGSLVGAILLFGWQAVSWTAIDIHANSFMYAPGQDSLMATISKTLSVDGEYQIPKADPKLPREEQRKIEEGMMTRPWAIINFHKNGQSEMGTTMLTGFINSIVCVLLACLVIRKFDDRYKTFFSLFTSTLTFGVVCFLFIWYNQHIWFQATWNYLYGEMIDNFMGWALVGVWLGWWYRK